MKHVTSNIRRFSATAAVLMIAVSLMGTTVFAEEDETVSYDGLERIESSRVAVAFIHPDADFSVFEWVAILEPRVAFRTNWQRDQNRSRSRNVRTSDMDRIKEDVAALFLDLGGFRGGISEVGLSGTWYFVKKLGIGGGFQRTDIRVREYQGDGYTARGTYSQMGAQLYLECAF